MESTGSGGSSTERKTLNVFQRLSSLFSQFISVANGIGSVWVFGLTFLICTDVIARGFFNAPIRGVSEIVAYSLAGAVFLQLAHSLHVGRFARAEMYIDPLVEKRPVVGALFHAIFSAAGVFVFGLIAFGTLDKLEEAWPDLKFGVEGEFTILVWPLRLIIMTGAIMVAIKYLVLTLERLSDTVAAYRKHSAERSGEKTGWLNLLIVVAVIAAIAGMFQADFGKVTVGAVSIVGMLILIFMGIHIGIALILLGFFGIWIMLDNPNIAINTVKLASNEFLRNFFLGVVPLFVLMGLVISESDIGKDTFDVARWLLRKIKGGLGVATVFANAIFAAITGSSIASAAVFTKVATPHMLRNGYTRKFAVGTVAGSSVLGMLIPPSLLLIVYAFVAEQSVGLLFLAAIIPGIILALVMAVSIIGMAHFFPDFVGHPTEDNMEGESVSSAFWKILPILLLVVVVMGGIYGGLFTPVEAGAIGAAGALIIAILKRRLTWKKLWNVLIETGHTTVSVLFLILAANIYGRMLALSGFPQSLGEFIGAVNLGFAGFLVLYVILVIIFGMFLDSISMMLILLPIVLPIVSAFGGDLIWFGIVTVIAVEMGLLTPPFGIAVYVVRSTIEDATVTLNQIFAGAFPYVIMMLFVTIILIVFPDLSTVWL
ncbi:MAG: TRAP transporter large permease subunit [Rhodospirillales bacterium]|nr:TRAP transporter large permease subunit [Rhodospirillales bacterium]